MGQAASLPKTWLKIAIAIDFKLMLSVASEMPFNRMLFLPFWFSLSSMRSLCWRRCRFQRQKAWSSCVWASTWYSGFRAYTCFLIASNSVCREDSIFVAHSPKSAWKADISAAVSEPEDLQGMWDNVAAGSSPVGLGDRVIFITGIFIADSIGCSKVSAWITTAISVSSALSDFSTLPAWSARLSVFSGWDPADVFELVEVVVAVARVEELSCPYRCRVLENPPKAGITEWVPFDFQRYQKCDCCSGLSAVGICFCGTLKRCNSCMFVFGETWWAETDLTLVSSLDKQMFCLFNAVDLLYWTMFFEALLNKSSTKTCLDFSWESLSCTLFTAACPPYNFSSANSQF